MYLYSYNDDKPPSGKYVLGADVDPYQELLTKAREIAEQLASSKTPTAYASDDGTTVQGWAFDNSSYSNEKHYGRGSFRETWGIGCRILTTEGKFFDYRHDYVETEEGRTETERLSECAANYLVGSSGKPFSKIMGQIERLPWTA